MNNSYLIENKLYINPSTIQFKSTSEDMILHIYESPSKKFRIIEDVGIMNRSFIGGDFRYTSFYQYSNQTIKFERIQELMSEDWEREIKEMCTEYSVLFKEQQYRINVRFNNEEDSHIIYQTSRLFNGSIEDTNIKLPEKLEDPKFSFDEMMDLLDKKFLYVRNNKSSIKSSIKLQLKDTNV